MTRTPPPAPEFLVVGFVTKPHGIRGDVLVQPLTDHPEGAFAPGVVLLQGTSDGRAPDDSAPPLRVDAARPFRRGLLVRFGGSESRNEAERLRGRYLLRRFEDVKPLAEGEVFYHQLLGLRVERIGGELVGTVREVYEVEPADLLEVQTERGSALIPFTRSVVVDVRVDQGRLIVDPPEGLLDL